MRRLFVILSLAALALPFPDVVRADDHDDVCIDPGQMPPANVGHCTYFLEWHTTIAGIDVEIKCQKEVPSWTPGTPPPTGTVGDTLRCIVVLNDCESRLPSYVAQDCVLVLLPPCEAGDLAEECVTRILQNCAGAHPNESIPDPCLTQFLPPPGTLPVPDYVWELVLETLP